MTLLNKLVNRTDLFARLLRSVGWTAFGFAAAQGIRLVTNLIFARLLFPEAFGLMALVSVFLVGLAMLSDVGISSSILQNKRGDEPDFLNTAWTIQVIRGALLWLGCCGVALPAADFYQEPMLAQLLPVAGLSLLIGGFNPTQIDSSNRHLQLGRVVTIDLWAQVISAVILIFLAFAMRSVWALVLGAVIGSMVKLALSYIFLPNAGNRFLWERPAVRELVHFGKWIFLSTACAFIIAQGDKAVLGKYLSLDALGVYNIGYFLASAPLMLAGAIIGRTMLPLYRERPPGASAANFRKIRMLRFGLTTAIMTLLLLMAFAGISIVNFLYDARYVLAGPIVVALAFAQIIQVVGLTYDQAALAAGDSRNFFWLFAARAVIQLTFFIIGIEMAGLLGAIAGQALSMLFVHPMIIALARRHKAWDPLHDAVFVVVGLTFGFVALWLHYDSIIGLREFGKL
jgi:O-antigen/teichoic acid export membrane protein